MEVSINGEKKSIGKDSLTVTELLHDQKVDMPDMVSVELNGEMLERSKFETATVKTGDEIEFLYFMGGGQ